MVLPFFPLPLPLPLDLPVVTGAEKRIRQDGDLERICLSKSATFFS